MKALLATLFLLASATGAGDLHIGKFSGGSVEGWDTKSFNGKTEYVLVKDQGTEVLKAHSKGTASGLIRKMKIDAKDYPVISWSWKVANVVKKEDVTKKNGEDFAARVYVIFPGTFIWQIKALVYVWSSHLPKDVPVSSPFTKNVMMIPVESGQEHVGQWMKEERNWAEDYRRAFKTEPPVAAGIGIMTDTDNTGDEATAWYGDIWLRKAQQPHPSPHPSAPPSPPLAAK